jgi:ParB family chromosome partitioning protein
MATKKKTKKKVATRKAAKKTTRKKKAGKLQPRKDKRGLKAAIGGYREPLSGRPMLLAALPLKAVQPTPFQRDLSPTHTKRLAQKIEESGSFLDPLIVVRGADGRLWTPNGRHRLAAAKVLGLHQITALVSPDEDLAFRILALNTEKAHNLKDRSLEVIRMARALAESKPRAKESEYVNEFEAPELLTLGIIYSENKRFAGGAYNPFLKKVDRFSDRTLRVSLRERENYAARLLQIETQVKRIIEGLQKRGFKSPYLRSYVVARINPVRFHRARKGDTTPPMTMAAALTRMAAAAKNFDIDSVKFGDLALVAAVASE